MIECLKGRAPVVQWLEERAHQGLAISLITYGKPYKSIYYGHTRQRRTSKHSDFPTALVESMDEKTPAHLAAEFAEDEAAGFQLFRDLFFANLERRRLHECREALAANGIRRRGTPPDGGVG